MRIIIKIEFTNVVLFFNVDEWTNEANVLIHSMERFTIGTGATLFFTFLFVLGKGKTFFVLVPINFLGGCAFFTPATESIGTYSIEIEYAALK